MKAEAEADQSGPGAMLIVTSEQSRHVFADHRGLLYTIPRGFLRVRNLGTTDARDVHFESRSIDHKITDPTNTVTIGVGQTVCVTYTSTFVGRRPWILDVQWFDGHQHAKRYELP